MIFNNRMRCSVLGPRRLARNQGGPASCLRVKGGTTDAALEIGTARLHRGVSRDADLSSGPLVSFPSAWSLCAAEASLAARPGSALRGAVGAFQGVLGRGLGGGARAGPFPLPRARLLDGLHSGRRRGAHPRWLLRGGAAQGRADPAALAALRSSVFSRSCRKGVGSTNT